jgi:hypothetical protein
MKNQLFLIFVCLFSIQSYSQDTIQLPKSDPFGEPGKVSRGTFGEDDRKEVRDAYGYEDYVRATAVMVPKENVIGNRVYSFTLRDNLSNQFQTENFDENVRYLDQPAAAYCTGFLIAPNILVTAGHCVSTTEAANEYVWIFDYTHERQYNFKEGYFTIPEDNIYEVREMIVADYDTDSGDTDYAVLELKKYSTRKPYRFRTSGIIDNGTPVNTIGTPSGLPLKFATNAIVVDNEPEEWFKSNIDAFPGNSGGPVFDQNGFLEGILVRGAVEYANGRFTGDYKYDQECDCIKTVSFDEVYRTAGCQAFKITELPVEVLIGAVYENLHYAVSEGNNKRFDDWDNYEWIYDFDDTYGALPLEKLAIFEKNYFALKKIMPFAADDINDAYSRELLDLAHHGRDFKTLQILLEAGLYPDAGENSAFTLLQEAVVSGLKEETELLIEYGADVNVKDNDNYNLLHLAATNGNKELIRVLISNGVSLEEKVLGKRPEKIAKRAGKKDLGKWLKKIRKGKVKVELKN